MCTFLVCSFSLDAQSHFFLQTRMEFSWKILGWQLETSPFEFELSQLRVQGIQILMRDLTRTDRWA